MRTCRPLCCLASFILAAFSVSTFSAASQPASRPQSQPDYRKQVEQHVRQLGADAYCERQAAVAELLRIGVMCRQPIEAATNSRDPEMAESAKDVLARLEFVTRSPDGQLLDRFRGRRVLVSIETSVEMNAANPKELLLMKRFEESLSQAGGKVVQVVYDRSGPYAVGGCRGPMVCFKIDQLLLLDCPGSAPDIRQKMPLIKTATVFQDGQLVEGNSEGADPKTACVEKMWTPGQEFQMRQDLKKIAGMPVEMELKEAAETDLTTPHVAKLKPKHPYTLLELCVWTQGQLSPK